ncbi:transposase [Synechococcus sp. 1G10]|uniref:transposase n=1 Tax=Synechococcus sp. 1G10 TaxID=2025605 RepID=UPI000B97F6B4
MSPLSFLHPGASWRGSMHRYSEGVKADVRKRMSPPHRQSVARISEELGIHVVTLYNWRKAWRLQGEVVPASEKAPRAGAH